MQTQLQAESVVVQQKKVETDALLQQVGQESLVAEEQAEIAAEEEGKVSAVQEEVQSFQESCLADLAAAEPAIKKAEAALDSLDKKALTELRTRALLFPKRAPPLYGRRSPSSSRCRRRRPTCST